MGPAAMETRQPADDRTNGGPALSLVPPYESSQLAAETAPATIGLAHPTLTCVRSQTSQRGPLGNVFRKCDVII